MTIPKEVLQGPMLAGPMMARTSSLTNQFAGRTTLFAGSVSVTVSTAIINSDSVLMLSSIPGSVGLFVDSGGHIVANSIVSGVSFSVARARGVASPVAETVCWQIIRTS